MGLCVSLFREGRISETLNCLKRQSNEDLQFFKQATGWEDFLLAGRRPQIDRSTLYAARSEHHVVITNCGHIARSEGLKVVKPWKGIREAILSQPS